MDLFKNIFDNDNINKTPICYIVAGMGLESIGFRPKISDFIIAADKGYHYLAMAGYKPHLTVGDFDSLGKAPDHENTIILPKHKDDTDTLYAIKEGIKKGFDTFVIHGGMGGRPDHTYANIQSLAFLAQKGKIGYLLGEGMAVTAIKNNSFVFSEKNKGLISIFSHSDKSTGVYTDGLLYSISDHTFTDSFPLGISNEFTGRSSLISVREGILIVMWYL